MNKKFLTALVTLNALNIIATGETYASTIYGMTQEQINQMAKLFTWSQSLGDKNPIFAAIQEGDMDYLQGAVKILKKDLKALNGEGESPLSFAIKQNQMEMAKYIYKQINPLVPDDDIDKKIQELAENPQDNAVKQEEEGTSSSENTKSSELSPIFDAIGKGDMASLQNVIENSNADPKALNSEGKSPLSYAIEQNQTEMAKYLCKQIYSSDEKISEEIHNLSWHLKELLSDDDSKLKSKYSALAIEIAKFMIGQSYTKDEFSNDKIVHLLILKNLYYVIEQEDNPDKVLNIMSMYDIPAGSFLDSSSYSLVFLAAKYNRIQTLQKLLEECTENTVLTGGQKPHPLIEAASNGNLEAVKLLCDHKNIEVKNEDLIAARNRSGVNMNVLEFLDSKTGKTDSLDKALLSAAKTPDNVKKIYVNMPQRAIPQE